MSTLSSMYILDLLLLNQLYLNNIRKPAEVLYIETYPGMIFEEFNHLKLCTEIRLFKGIVSPFSACKSYGVRVK